MCFLYRKRAMQTGETPYAFSSTAHPSVFTGTLWAPLTTQDHEGHDVIFDGWENCQYVHGPDDSGCYIGEGTWYDEITPKVMAYYESESESPTSELIVEMGGDGTVTSDGEPPKIDCPGTCTDYFESGSSVTLTAEAGTDSYFVGWDPLCPCAAFGDNPVCTLSMDSDKQVLAEFALKPLVTVNIIGNGMVISDLPGINCDGPGSCSAYFDPGTDIGLIESPDSYWEFGGWTGDCSGGGDCSLPAIDEDKTVNALFESIGPIAAMYSFVNPAEDDCGGPGCEWGEVTDPWITYHGTQYKIVNDSTFPNPAIMYTSDWYFDGWLYGEWSCEEGGGIESDCHIGNIAGMAVDAYTVKLEVTDEHGAYDETAEQDLIIRPDTNADFKCSLDEADVVGQDCGDVTPLTGQTVYFIDDSTPSGGATDIIEWTWQKGYMDGGSFVMEEGFGNSETAFTELYLDSDTIKLIVKDDHAGDAYYAPGRGDSEIKSLTIQLSLPKYREVAPR